MTGEGQVREQLAAVSLFEGVAPGLLERVAAASADRRYVTEERIFSRGDQGTSLYVLVEGRVRIEVVASSERALLLGTMGVGEVFGDLAVFDEGPRSADAVALEEDPLSGCATRCGVGRRTVGSAAA